MHPVTQAMENELARNRMIAIEGVSTTRIVAVVRSTRVENIVDTVLETLEGEDRPHLISFASVVKYHVQDDLDTSLVKCLHHLLELIDLGPGLF